MRSKFDKIRENDPTLDKRVVDASLKHYIIFQFQQAKLLSKNGKHYHVNGRHELALPPRGLRVLT